MANRELRMAAVDVICYKPVPDQRPNAYNQTACPWQK